ncbi:MAG: hypothetical protein LUG16_08100 [Candidatus Gastranaerophilales bacterium]|nr:hypothetical protein [Candidatus Gastranaerophilales bacterium]
MGGLPKKIFLCTLLIIFINGSSFALEIENTADNPRLVNITKEQKRYLKTMEKRLYNNSFEFENNIDRIERLELDLMNGIQKGSATQRIKNLRIASTRAAIRGTAMTPMMNDTFNSRYINPGGENIYQEDVGIIDGLIRVWWPDFYKQLNEYRKYKEANFY